MENGNDPIPLLQAERAPILLLTQYVSITFNVGKVLDEEGGVKGIVLDFFTPATPWHRHQLPFDRLSALDLIMRLKEALSLDDYDRDFLEDDSVGEEAS